MVETGFKLDYFILQSLLVLISILIGYRVSIHNKNNTDSPFKSDVPIFNYFFLIIVFSLIEGLRYGRGPDHIAYVYRYENYRFEEYELFFSLLNKTMNIWGFAYWHAFIVYSFFWILGGCMLARHFKKINLYVLPLFILISLPQFENLIRQFLGLSFVLIAISYYYKEKYLFFLLFVILAYGSHKSVLLIVGTMIVFIVYNKTLPFKLTLLLLFYFTFLWNIENIGFFTQYLEKVNIGDEHFGAYIDQSSSWFSSDAINKEFARGIIGKVAGFLFDGILIFFGGKYIMMLEANDKTKKISIILYNIFVIGAIGMQFGFTLEIVRRVFISYYIFCFIIAAFSFDYLKKNMKGNTLNSVSYAFLMLYVIGVFLIKYIYGLSSQMYIWDVK